jgi:hypothetical protein
VQTADGTPVVSQAAAPDRPTALPLAGAAPGDLAVVEGLAADGTLIALGAAPLDEQGGCVCLARRAWRATTVYQDGAGAKHFGPHTGFFVGTPPPGLVPTRLQLDRTVVAADDRPVANFAFVNTSQTTLTIRALTILARPPNAGHDSAALRAFTSATPDPVAAGAMFAMQATGMFTAADPPGTWAIFARYRDALDVPHDGPELEFFVGAANDALVPQTPLRFEPQWVPAGVKLHGNVTLVNRSAAAVTVMSGEITARAPGDDDATGTPHGFGNLQNATVAPGTQLGMAGDLPFTEDQDPCADKVCTVDTGGCHFSVTP